MQVQSLGQEDPLGKEMATHSSIHAWKIPWTEDTYMCWHTGISLFEAENWIKDLLSVTLPKQNKTQIPPQPVPPIRKLPQASYPYLSEGIQNGNHNYRKLTKLITCITALSNSVNYEPCHVGPPKMDRSW